MFRSRSFRSHKSRFDAYLKAAQQFTLAWTELDNIDTAATEIDRVISACITHSRPVYIMLPTDMAYAHIPKGALDKPLTPHIPENDQKVEDFVVADYNPHKSIAMKMSV